MTGLLADVANLAVLLATMQVHARMQPSDKLADATLA